MPGKTIGFITDLGIDDDAVGMCKGMMLAISPESQIVDITHSVTPFDVVEAAHYMADLPDFFPDDAVIACIVYPETGVGPCVVVRNSKGQLYVVPDNGVVTLVVDASGFDGAWEIQCPDVQRYPPTPSFCGRDVVAACAAHLAAGVSPEDVGPRRDEIAELPFRRPELNGDGGLVGEIAVIDKNFGNVWTNIPLDLCRRAGILDAPALELEVGGRRYRWPFRKTFGEVGEGEPLAFFNSRDRLAFALNQGSLAERIGDVKGLEIHVRPVAVAAAA
jgi:S-adenosylmethionine hydrolase